MPLLFCCKIFEIVVANGVGEFRHIEHVQKKVTKSNRRSFSIDLEIVLHRLYVLMGVDVVHWCVLLFVKHKHVARRSLKKCSEIHIVLEKGGVHICHCCFVVRFLK